jgi:hypothetical protein
MSSLYHTNDGYPSILLCGLKSAKRVQKNKHKNWPGLSDRTILEVQFEQAEVLQKDGCQIKRKASG